VTSRHLIATEAITGSPDTLPVCTAGSHRGRYNARGVGGALLSIVKVVAVQLSRSEETGPLSPVAL